jgi:H+/Cl- antiporter ClcA
VASALSRVKLNWKLILPALVAGSVGFGVYDVITQTIYGPIYSFPAYSGFQFVQLLEAVLLGVIGGLVGVLFIRFYRAIKTRIRKWEMHPIELALIAGLILGVVAMAFPLVLFDGQNQISVLLKNTTEYGLVMLLALAFLKLFVTAICLAFGWNGGYIFPSLFIGASLGLALHIIFPFIPEIVCLACTMVSVIVILLRSPIAMTILVLGLFGFHIVPIVMVSAVTAFILGLGETLLLSPSHPAMSNISSPGRSSSKSPSVDTSSVA